MNARRIAAVVVTSALTAALVIPAAQASDPASSEVTVPQSAGDSVESTWTGSIPPGEGESAPDCPSAPTNDVHEITINVPVGTYGGDITVLARFEVVPDASTDAEISVEMPNGKVVHDDAGFLGTAEAITLFDPPPGLYKVYACPYASANPANTYEGSLTMTAQSKAVAPTALHAPADAQGLAFSASTVADIQRDEAEPLIEIAPDGTMYTCGPTGFSQSNEYAQNSVDGGDQFHLLGEPPRGQLSGGGGGGDCGLAISPEPNEDGHHDLAYSGLSGLLNFSVARSSDSGATFESVPFSESIPGVDRQWNVALDNDTVLMTYNRVVPRDVTVQTSNDGGLTYSEPVAVAPNPTFPGPVRALPPDLNPADNGEAAPFFTWTEGSAVRFAISFDGGANWNNCTAANSTASPNAGFTSSDHDLDGNVYVAYANEGPETDQDTYAVVIRNDDLLNCDGPQATGSQGILDDPEAYKSNPGFSDPVRVNGEPITTTVFPWLAAGGAPGRVAVAYMGTDVEAGTAAPVPKTWHVYVGQTLNMLDALDGANVRFSMVQATTHPNHYDSVCLDGLACDLPPVGDRSMADFFAMDLNPATGELAVVFNRTHKRPGDAAGLVATPVVVRQIAGPSNLGGTVSRPDRTPLRNFSVDPVGDAIADWSSQFQAPRRAVIPAADITSVKVGPAVDPATGDSVTEDAGFTVTATIDDLSDAALQAAMQDAQTMSLMYIFRFVDGFRYSAAVANWNAVQGFTFGFNEFAGAPSECVATEFAAPAGEDGCLKYPADMDLDGHVDQETGTITMTVPLSYLEALEPGDPVPTERPAKLGDRIYTSAMYVQSNKISPTPALQSWLEPIDNSPAFDFIIGARTPDGSPGQDPEPDPDAGAPDPGTAPPTPVTGGGLALLGLLALAGATMAVRRTR